MLMTESASHRMDHAGPRPSHRKRRRYPAYLDADIDTGYLRGKGTVLSLSEAGLFTTADLPLRKGARVTVSFELPDLAPVTLDGEVIYEASHLDHLGLGVRFITNDATDDGIAAIRHFFQAC